MNFFDSKAKLSYALKKLQLHWEQTQTQWRDTVSHDFERSYLEPLGQQVAATVQAIDRLVDVLRRAQQECQSSVNGQ
jgi:hypothetical protein